MKLRTAAIVFAAAIFVVAYQFVQPRIVAQGRGASQAPADTDLDGTLEVVYEDGYIAPRLRHFLHVGTDRIELNFAGHPPRIETGTHVHARGRLRSGRLDLDAADVEALGAYGTGTPGVQTIVSPNTFGVQSTIVILINFTDLVQQPYTTASANTVTFTQVNNFDLENSFQQTSLSGTVAGWYTIAASSTTCNYNTWASLAEQAATNAGYNLNLYPRRVFGFPQTNACNWWGLGTIGGGNAANPSRAWINGTYSLRVVAHEMGHNFGLYHSRSNTCDGTGCVVDEYGDDHDSMGGGPGSITGHFNAYQKERIGWLDYGSSPSLETVTDAGEYAIEPYATPWGGLPKAIKVLKSSSGGSSTYVYAEARTQYGVDSTLPPGVIIHTGVDTDGSQIYQQDVQPSSTNTDFILDVGQSITFADAAGGVTVRTLTFDTSGAIIEVTPTCPVSLGSSGQSYSATGGAGSVSMTTSASCSWTATSDSAWLTVNPGSESGTGSATIQYTVATNPNSTPRTGILTIGTQTYTATQAGNACSFGVSPASQFFNYLGGNGTVTVTTPGGCNWSVTGVPSWITINTGASGSGNGTVTYSVASQLTAHVSRAATMSVAGQPVTVTQEGVAAQFVVPTDGATAVATSSTFSWTNVSAQGYILLVGTTPGGSDLVSTGLLSSSTTTFSVSNLPSSQLLYARVRTRWSASTFTAADITFTTIDHLSGITLLGTQAPSPVVAGGSTQYGAAAASSVRVTFSGTGGGCSVALSATGLPSGASATFNPSTLASSAANQFSWMSVSTTGSTPAGSTNFTVRAQETGVCGSGLFTTTAPLSVLAATSLSATTASGTYGGTVGVSATLTSSGSPISGKSVAFTLNGASVGSAVTNASGVATIAGASLSGIAPGTYPSGVSASFAGDSNNGSSNATNTLTVAQKSVAPAITAANKPYDATTSATLNSCTLTGLVSGDVANCTGTVTFASAAVGTGKTVTATGLTLSGPQAANYTLSTTSATTTANITAISLTPSVTASSKTYDRTVNAALSSCTLTGVLNGDVVTCSGTATFASAGVGTGKTVTASGLALGGAQAGNYSLSTTTATTAANITAVSVTPSVTAANRPYDATTSASLTNCTLTGVLSPDVVTCSGTASFASSAVGTSKTVTAGGLTLSGAQAGNYTLSTTSATTTASITAVSLTPSITAANKAYDRTTAATINSCSLSGVIAGDVVTCSGTATFGTSAVGTGKAVTATGLTLSGAQASNYTLSTTTATTTANITAISVTPSVAAASKPYDATTSASLTSCTLTGVLSPDVATCNGTASFANGSVGAGKTVTATGLALSGAQAGNYALSTTSATTSASITAASLTPSIAAASRLYDATVAASITNCALAGVVGSDVVTCSGTAHFDSAAVGTGKTVTATGLTLGGTAAPNYSLSASTATATANITAVTLTATVAAASKPYDRSTSAAITNCALAGVVGSDVVTCSGTANFDSAAVGTGKTVTATGLALGGTAAGNYALSSTTATTSAAITALSVTPAITAASKPYDRAATATISSCTLAGVLAPDVVTCSGTATFDSAVVGSGKTVTATGLTLGGAAAGNYALSTTTATTTAAITAISVTPAITAANKPYDKNASATITNCSLTGVLAPDVVTCSGTATFSSAAVGTNKTVTATGVTLGGGAANNYALSTTTATTTANISAVSVTPAIAAANKTYDATAAAAISSCTLTGVLSGDVVTCSGSATFDSAAVGTGKTVTVTGLTLGGAAAGNYTLSATTATTTANITAMSVTPSITVPSKPYDRTATATISNCTLTGVLGGDVVTCSGTASFDSAAVGTGRTVTATGLTLGGAQANNYALSTTTATATANITPITVSPTITAASKAYDGTTAATLTGCTLGGIIAGDVVTCGGTASFNSAAVGTGKTVTASNLALSGTAAGNYTLSTTTATTTAAITAIAVTPIIAASNKAYDGTATATLTNCTVSGVIVGDVVACAGTASFDSVTAGTGKTVTATGLALTGASASNYALSSTTATTTADINALSVTPAIIADSKTYDGTTVAALDSCTVLGALSNDQVACTGTAVFESASVAFNKTVAAFDLTLTGPAAANYILATHTAVSTADIFPKVVTPSITLANKTYDGTTIALDLTCTLTGVIADDDVTCSDVFAYYETAEIGANKPVVITGAALAGAAKDNYIVELASFATTASITPAPLTASISAVDKIYDGTTSALVTACTLTGVVEGDTVECAGQATYAAATVGTDQPISASALTLTGPSAGNYVLASTIASATASIAPAAVIPAVTAASKPYDGTTLATLTSCTLSTSAPLTIGWDSNTSDEGVLGYVVRVSATLGGDGQVFNVGNATSFVYPNVAAGHQYFFAVAAYNGAGMGPFAEVSGFSQAGGPFAGDDISCSGTAAFDTPAIGSGKSVTTSALTLTGASAGNYTLATSAVATTAAITGSAVTPMVAIADKSYDGTMAAMITNCTVSGLVGGDVVGCTGTAQFDSPGAGNGKTVTISDLALTGPAAGNYTLIAGTVTSSAAITAITVSPAIAVATKVYDGTTNATVTSCTLAGVLAGDTVACAGNASFDSSSVGVNKTVTASNLTLTGASAGNYALATGTATGLGSITPAHVSPTVVVASKVYDGNTTASLVSCTLPTAVPGDQVSCTGTAVFADSSVGGGKVVTVTGLSLTGPAAGNYQLVDPNVDIQPLISLTTSGTIEPKTVTATVSAANKAYDGTTVTTLSNCTLAGAINGDSVTCTGSPTFGSPDAGVGKSVTVTGLSLTGPDAANYALGSTTASTTASITPLALTPAITASDKVYDGTTAATLTSCQVTGAMGGDVVGCVGSAAFDTATAGAGKTVTATGLTLTGTTANYTLGAVPATTTAAITPLGVTSAVSVANKTYDGTMTAAITGCAVTGTLGGDVLGCTGNAIFDSANAGTGKSVTISSLALTGAAAVNYSLGSTTSTAVANITPLTLAASGVVVAKTYDGMTTASLSNCTVQGALEGDTIACTGTAAFDTPAVGTNKGVTISGLSLTGAAAANYTLSSTTATATGTINQRSVTPVITAANKRYDGTTAATVTSCTLSSVIGGDAVTCSAAAAFASAAAGTNKPVTATQVTLGGAAAANYALATTAPTTTASIIANALPAITNPGSQLGYQGVALALPLTATDADGDSLTWSSSSLVPGTTLNPSTGVISGTPTAQGGFTVVVSVFDGWDTTQVSFSWAVGSPVPAAASLSGPIGSITTTTPTFTWPAVPMVEYYLLWITDSGSDSPLQVWYTPAQAGCAAGGNCVASSPRALRAGLVTWKVITWNHFGYGPWSSLASVVVDFADPSVPTPTTSGPSGAVGTRTPTYSWGAVANATWYQLSITDVLGVVREFWYTPSQVCTTSCAANPTSPVAVGLAKWHVRAWRVTGAGSWSGYTSFDAADGVPGTPTLLTPTGSVTSSTTSFTWNALSAASYYLLRYTDRDNVATERWYRPADVGCMPGTGTCTANPGIVLKAGAATWKVLAWNGSGYGQWSEERSILIEIPDPSAPAPLPVSPTGSITSSSTQYRWTAVPAAINYRVSIRNNGGTPTYFWYSPVAAGCDAASECSIVPLISRTNGTEQWQVQAWTTTGYGPWSTLVSLAVNITAPLAPVAVSPSGLTTATTVFKWNAAANTTYYYVRVFDSTGQRVDKWPTPAQVGCSTGGVCTFTTGVTLASGAGSWQVLAWNPSGYSQWSSTMAFTVP